MAQQTVITLIDDLDPSATADETVKFGLDGRDYEIDLANDNAEKLRDLLRVFVDAARRPQGRRGFRTAAVVSRTTSDRERNQAIRAWAADNGMELAERGRIAERIVEAWANAGAPTSVQRPAPKKVEPVVFEDPAPVEGAPWNHLDEQERAQVKGWAELAGIEQKRWTRNSKARNAMSTFALNNDTKGAQAYIDAL